MKRETLILVIVVAFLAGFVSGATVAILKVKGGGPGVAARQKPQMASQMPPQMGPQVAPTPAAPGPPPAEVSAKIQALKDATKKDPKNLAAWQELGNLYFDSDQPKEAINAYKQYLAVKPDNPDVRTDLGIMLRKTGEFDRALGEFRKAAQIDPKHVNSRYNLGLVLLHDKQDIKGAIQAWEEYLKVEDPKSERAVRMKAQIEKMKKMVK